MASEFEYSLTRSFVQSNPAGPGQDDVPALLRRVADSISELGDIDVLDIVFHVEATAMGSWPSLTVYYVPNEEEPPAQLRVVGDDD